MDIQTAVLVSTAEVSQHRIPKHLFFLFSGYPPLTLVFVPEDRISAEVPVTKIRVSALTDQFLRASFEGNFFLQWGNPFQTPRRIPAPEGCVTSGKARRFEAPRRRGFQEGMGTMRGGENLYRANGRGGFGSQTPANPLW